MKKCFAFLLTLVLTLSLTACGSESRQLVGAWHGSILPGITQKLNSVVSEALGTEYTSEQEADLWLNAVFNKDGTFTISMDEDATAASLTGYMEALRPTIVELCYQEAEKQGMTRVEYDKALEASDLTVEGLVDTILSALDPAALLGAIADSSITGYYKLTGGRLYLSQRSGSFTEEDSTGCDIGSNGTIMSWNDDNGLLSSAEMVGITAPMLWRKQS